MDARRPVDVWIYLFPISLFLGKFKIISCFNKMYTVSSSFYLFPSRHSVNAALAHSLDSWAPIVCCRVSSYFTRYPFTRHSNDSQADVRLEGERNGPIWNECLSLIHYKKKSIEQFMPLMYRKAARFSFAPCTRTYSQSGNGLLYILSAGCRTLTWSLVRVMLTVRWRY